MCATAEMHAEQSSSEGGKQGDPSRAVDGYLRFTSEADIEQGCTATDPAQVWEANHWLRVDTGRLHKIFYVRVSRPENDCCGE